MQVHGVGLLVTPASASMVGVAYHGVASKPGLTAAADRIRPMSVSGVILSTWWFSGCCFLVGINV